MTSFVKFPSTPHLLALDGVTVRDDKILTPLERESLLAREVIVEEKIDGANLGISFSAEGAIQVQNRGAWLHLPVAGQWKSLPEWLANRTELLFDVLSDRYILFGEWCYAKHSILYNRLPDWFVGFDVYDLRANRFVSRSVRDDFLSNLELHAVPCLAIGCFSIKELTAFLGQSRFGDGSAEGLYLRCDDGNWLDRRAKLVRPGFIQSIQEHWSRGPLLTNRLTVNKQAFR